MRILLSHIRVRPVIVCVMFCSRRIDTESLIFRLTLPRVCVQLDLYPYYTQIFELTRPLYQTYQVHVARSAFLERCRYLGRESVSVCPFRSSFLQHGRDHEYISGRDTQEYGEVDEYRKTNTTTTTKGQHRYFTLINSSRQYLLFLSSENMLESSSQRSKLSLKTRSELCHKWVLNIPLTVVLCIVWCGVVWYSMVWYGMVWYGMVWYGIVCIHVQNSQESAMPSTFFRALFKCSRKSEQRSWTYFGTWFHVRLSLWMETDCRAETIAFKDEKFFKSLHSCEKRKSLLVQWLLCISKEAPSTNVQFQLQSTPTWGDFF